MLEFGNLTLNTQPTMKVILRRGHDQRLLALPLFGSYCPLATQLKLKQNVCCVKSPMSGLLSASGRNLHNMLNSIMKILAVGCETEYKRCGGTVAHAESRRDQEEGGELDSQEEVRHFCGSRRDQEKGGGAWTLKLVQKRS